MFLKNSFVFIIILFLTACANNDAEKTLQHIPQNVIRFVNPSTANIPLIPAGEQKQQTEKYLQHYFSPWTGQQTIYSLRQIKQYEIQFANQYQQAPGYDENYQPYTQSLMLRLINNMNLENFPIRGQPGILINNADIRILPIADPSFNSWQQAGQWYPFDNWQETHAHVNTPVLIILTSRDEAWDLVLLHNDFGWVQSDLVAQVTPEFERQWQVKHYIAITSDNTNITDQKNIYRFAANLGAVFPLIQANKNYDEIAVAIKNVTGNAQIVTATIPVTAASILPLPLTSMHIAVLANSLLGNPYGWGGIYGYRDCSSTMADLFTPFGIWLPRNSGQQIHIGKFISFANLTEKQKEQLIIGKGIPFLTLIGLPGHITLYIGQKNGVPYVFHDYWGLHTRNILWHEGRAVVGQTIVTPINFGTNYINVHETLISKADGMTVL